MLSLWITIFLMSTGWLAIAQANPPRVSELEALLSPSASISSNASSAPRWSDYHAPQPGLIVHVANEQDVAETVRLSFPPNIHFDQLIDLLHRSATATPTPSPSSRNPVGTAGPTPSPSLGPHPSSSTYETSTTSPSPLTDRPCASAAARSTESSSRRPPKPVCELSMAAATALASWVRRSVEVSADS